MALISRQMRLPYSAAQMYALVNDVASYPAFVPWCTNTQVHSQDSQHMRASIEMAYQGLHKTFTTENKLDENQSIRLNLVQGPLKSLSGQWRFEAITAQQCQVDLSVELSFENRLVALLFAKVMQKVVDRVIKAFCDRAQVLYD